MIGRVKRDPGHRILSCLPLLLGIVYISPILMLVVNAFKPQGEIVLDFLALPRSLYLGNIREAATILHYWISFRNTAIITILTTLGACLSAFMCAYSLSHLSRRLSNGVYLAFVLGQMVPFHVIMVPVYVMASRMGLTDTFIGVVLFGCGFNVSFGIVMYTGFLKGVTRELEEAAEIDGSGILGTMFRIVFPLLAPTTATICILYFLWTWNDFLFPSIMLSGVAHRTLMSNISNFKTTTSTRWDLMIAGLLICIIPIIVIYLFAQKYIVKGITAGAVKT